MRSWLKRRLDDGQVIWKRLAGERGEIQQAGTPRCRQWSELRNSHESEVQLERRRPEDNILLTELAGLKDPYSQSPFNLERQIYKCRGCGAFYNETSVAELQTSNNSLCIICSDKRVEKVTLIRTDRMRRRWRKQSRFHEPD